MEVEIITLKAYHKAIGIRPVTECLDQLNGLPLLATNS
jgi:hypothetical protein